VKAGYTEGRAHPARCIPRQFGLPDAALHRAVECIKIGKQSNEAALTNY